MPPRKPVRRRKKVAPASIGLLPPDVVRGVESGAAELDRLSEAIERDGGVVIARYRDPFGGTPLLIAALGVDRVEPTPYQRDPSEAHVKRLMGVIEALGRFLDPIIVVRHGGGYWTPNGNHRLQALKKLGARTVTAIVVPDADVAFKILALNTEKAHNLREKSLETIRMARALAGGARPRDAARERDFAFEFDQPAYLTLGVGYEARPRLGGGAYQPILKRIDEFLDDPIDRALRERERRGRKLLQLDDAVAAAVDKLRSRGLTSPYLKAFVVARVNYTRFSKAASFDFDEALDRITGAAGRFNVERVRQEDVAKAGGPPDAEE
jgi:ParB family chromosome partitioning protein